MAVAREEPSDRNRTLILIAASLVLAAAAVFVGIDDNLPGIALGLASAITFVAAFAHEWRDARPFRRLVYVSLAAAVGFVIISSLIEAASARGDIAPSLDAALNVLATAIMLLVPAGLVVGIVGWVLTGRRSVGTHRPAD